MVIGECQSESRQLPVGFQSTELGLCPHHAARPHGSAGEASCCALAERGAQAPLLLLATTRPELRPPWSLRSHHSVISLSPLDRAKVARMVGEISARHALSKEVIEGVSERTGGHHRQVSRGPLSNCFVPRPGQQCTS
jgi:hypothetical protein